MNYRTACDDEQRHLLNLPSALLMPLDIIQRAGNTRVRGRRLPKLTVSLTFPPSNSRRRVSADSEEVVAMSRP